MLLKTFTLLLPALIPSWRFFDVIAPSPRIEFSLLSTETATPDHWQEFHSRPSRVPISHMIRRVFWNPHWNDDLYLVSCAERLMEHPTVHSSQQIQNRIDTATKVDFIDIAATPYFQFRLVFLSRQGTDIQKEIACISPVYQFSERTAA